MGKAPVRQEKITESDDSRTLRLLHTNLKGDFVAAAGAANVEAENVQAQIVFVLYSLFGGIELGALVNVVATVDAAHVEGRHQTNGKLTVLAQAQAREF